MKKEEFLQLLRRALTGDVPPGVVEENIRYYDNYITEEVQKGSSEEDVIAEIGDPRLIAKTIEDTTDGADGQGYTDAYDDGSSQSQGSYGQNANSAPAGGFHTFDLSKWYWKLLLVVVVVGFFSIIFTLVGGLFSLLMPFIGPLIMIWMVVRIIKMFSNK